MTVEYRRKRGTDTEALHILVRPEVKRRIEQLANASHLPQWAIVEAAIMSGDGNSHAVPEEWGLTGPDGEPRLPSLQKTA
ncbi:hypothetical protein [Micrococcus luteus]|uniref:hypothetical protein n=1 Tax=Micrococcus luteus TaxID=1270 RepID=UPI000A99A0FC|nr:hypothetical protein [Micrococcus luteus]MBN6749445.1 hypothetical protein [Micrococcus luteus]MBN6759443.1 hypothetical protein [Micrococcus luteus]MBN6800837.1 hypothetical protein [Micrococcus luteus]TKD53477.1 hypothetical protein FBF74_10810 [Micrococcus luteus]